jgi:hypothetical protein
MSEPRVTFEEFSYNTRNTYRFYEDRIERDWKVIIRSGKEVYPTSRIASHLAEQTTFAYGLKSTLQSFGIYLIIGAILHLGFDHTVLNRIGFVLYGFAMLAGFLVLMKLKKDTWLYVKQVDGSTLFCVREKGLKGISRDAFIEAVRRYSKTNPPSQRDAESRPPSDDSSTSAAPSAPGPRG